MEMIQRHEIVQISVKKKRIMVLIFNYEML